MQGNRVNEFSNIFTAVSGAGVPARLPPKAAKIHPATYFGRVCDAGWRRQAGGDARPTENSLHPIALGWNVAFNPVPDLRRVGPAITPSAHRPAAQPTSPQAG